MAISRPVRAVVSVALGAVVGALTSVITSGFSWPVLAGLVVLGGAWLVLVYLDNRAAPAVASRTRVDVTALNDAEVRGNRVDAQGDATATLKADHGSSITRNKVKADGADTTQHADQGGKIDNNDITASS
ncbi:hypothetical protein EDD99_5054 [Streptomyces sp. 846.5]|nr:hypothetical protein [Streptomyces sp. 846.5]TDU06495.1 hypothetical protein EDD99_5054 [Streptomyces sp. 846.5]